MEIGGLVLLMLALLTLLPGGDALECYVCHRQDDNTGKCLNTIKTCDYEEDRCLSEIRWSTTPYWTEGARKQYYVNKKCATKEICDKEISDSMELCHYIWYEDWKCTECCVGDRCNYYVTLGSSTLTSNRHLIALVVAVSSLMRGWSY